MKTLVVTLNHNQKDLTDNLVEQISKDSSPIWVIDNGSKKEERSKYTAIQLSENIFFGGGINVAIEKFLKTEYDFLWFLNNDLIFNGNNIVTVMTDIAESENLDILSPSITVPEKRQCYWKQMLCWYSPQTRPVHWIDFQAPLMSRRFLERVIQFPKELHMGWGIDFLSGYYCEKWDMNIGVTDRVNMIHLDSKTLKDGKVDGWDINRYSHQADRNMNMYFSGDSKLNDWFQEMRLWGSTYKF